ncbi:GFA family protein [Halomonas sp. BC04]|uniref:GFA family protein n=1 Tax=Halomonas sp. BC04 TaxID=1403540 RepID=UPI0003ED6DB9|nr:GFA family protein [Halomonas sp. BC04]EWG97946.1 aldehyde-activating protein [Halomonas sp. BC04]
MSDDTTYKGSCFCGSVQLLVSGEPEAMGYCHCDSCRQWSAAPINAFTLWKPAAVHITKGEENIGTYNKSPQSFRKWCKTCGGHILTEHPELGLTDVYAAILPELPFTPGLHVHYQEKVLPVPDGLDKFKDAPEEIGGSGIRLSE